MNKFSFVHLSHLQGIFNSPEFPGTIYTNGDLSVVQRVRFCEDKRKNRFEVYLFFFSGEMYFPHLCKYFDNFRIYQLLSVPS